MTSRKRLSAASGLTRRQFIRRTAAAAGGLAIAQAPTWRGAAAAKNANERLGVGFIGCGGRSRAHLNTVHWLNTQAGEPVEIAAVCDVYRPRMQKLAEQYNAKAYTDYREMLADANVDVVCISTPDHHHGYQAIDAVRAGKDVYCEKPVTHWRQFELTKRLAAEVKNSGRVFQLGTQGMSDSAWHQMKRLVSEGLIGQPIHAECGFFRVGDWGERGMPIDDPNATPGSDLDWAAFLGDAPKRAFDVSRFFRWRMYEDYAGGPCTDLFPHSLTPVVAILGAGMPTKVVATGGKFRYQEREVPDTFNILIDYPEKITVAVLGTQGNDNQGTASRGSGKRVPVIRGWEGSLTVQGKQIVFIPAKGSKKKPQRFDIEHDENLVDYWQKFLDCCRTDQPRTLSPMDLAYHVQTALQMGMLALRDEKVAKFDPANEHIVL
jgi:predicted dehydrogenase